MLCLFKCIMFYGCIDMRIFHFGICTPDHVGGGCFGLGLWEVFGRRVEFGDCVRSSSDFEDLSKTTMGMEDHRHKLSW